MKIKILILTALMGYSSISSALTFYDCKSVDKDLNQTLTVSQTPSRAPSKDVTVKITAPESIGQYFIMKPKLTKSNGSITVNTFESLNSAEELSIIIDNPFAIQFFGSGSSDFPLKSRLPDYSHCPEHSRAPCFPSKIPNDPKPNKITTVAILVNNGLTTTYQCND